MTFIIILLLPTSLTFVTLLLHRVRASRAAQRERAPETIVHHLPWRVFTGNGWEKHPGYEDPHTTPTTIASTEEETSSHPQPPAVPLPNRPWFESQVECAICLSDFVKGDKVRVLPCHHIFHLDEVDEWLIKRRKLVCSISGPGCH
jgi:E3 ubiquitin-protein ligase RNF13/E3 ubiquitin-protein ligase RNF167